MTGTVDGMWELVRITEVGPNVPVSEHATEEQALAAGEAVEDMTALLVVRHDGVDVWTNEAGPFERLV